MGYDFVVRTRAADYQETQSQGSELNLRAHLTLDALQGETSASRNQLGQIHLKHDPIRHLYVDAIPHL